MTQALRRLHLHELQVANDHVARGKVLVAKQQAIARHLQSTGGPARERVEILSCRAEILLSLLKDSQKLFENHADRLNRELAREP